MKKMQKIAYAAAAIIGNVMCATVGYQYCDMQWRIAYRGNSAPASVAYLWSIPFIVCIAVCLVIAKKPRNNKVRLVGLMRAKPKGAASIPAAVSRRNHGPRAAFILLPKNATHSGREERGELFRAGGYEGTDWQRGIKYLTHSAIDFSQNRDTIKNISLSGGGKRYAREGTDHGLLRDETRADSHRS